ncbi:MAG: DUF418 domain-containing protein, partial [Calditrichales bacterium]|nr:DUF418 domain-containing protein [Calditrichales bacterium]
MTTLKPIEPKQRIEILDILRGFALLGIIFNNMLYFSGYSFMPFDNLKQIINFSLNESIYSFLDFIIRAKFYTLFSILFAVGFYLQFNKYREDSIDFLKTYRRRIFILLIIGFIHSLIWFGDILLTYSIIAFILILFRNARTKNILRWALFFMLLPLLLDLTVFPFVQAPDVISAENTAAVAHVIYPDMAPEVVINTFQNGAITELFFLNIHNIVWKYLSYIPSGGLLKILGIFLFGYYFASIGFFTNKNKSNSLLISSLIIGLLATISAKILGGNVYQFPPTLPNILYKFLLTAGQIFMCIFYIISIFKIAQTSIGKRVLNHLIPVGRMALSNYLFQTIIMITIFYNFGFNLIGRIGLIPIMGIVLTILI